MRAKIKVMLITALICSNLGFGVGWYMAKEFEFQSPLVRKGVDIEQRVEDVSEISVFFPCEQEGGCL